jgi:hypothetical protein
LGHAETLGRLGEALSLDDGAERRQLARIHKGSLWAQRRSQAASAGSSTRLSTGTAADAA